MPPTITPYVQPFMSCFLPWCYLKWLNSLNDLTSSVRRTMLVLRGINHHLATMVNLNSKTEYFHMALLTWNIVPMLLNGLNWLVSCNYVLMCLPYFLNGSLHIDTYRFTCIISPFCSLWIIRDDLMKCTTVL